MTIARLLPLILLSACAAEPKTDNHQVPELANIAETPGDWAMLEQMIGRTPAASGLLEDSPVSVDISARLGADFAAYRAAMMRAGPLVRKGGLLVSEGPDASLVLQPAEHAFRASQWKDGKLRQWQTPGTHVPAAPR